MKCLNQSMKKKYIKLKTLNSLLFSKFKVLPFLCDVNFNLTDAGNYIVINLFIGQKKI